MLHLLGDLNREGISVLLTTHDLNSVAAHLPWVICLNKRVVAQGTPDDVFTPEILGRTYGAEMIVVRQGNLILVSDRLSATRSGLGEPTAAGGRRVILLEPFRYEFFARGLIAATLVGALCGLVGVYIVLRRMSYIGHGLSHAVFGGAVASYVMGVNFYVGAGLWGFAAALLINALVTAAQDRRGRGHRHHHHGQLRVRRRADQPVPRASPATSRRPCSATSWASRTRT